MIGDLSRVVTELTHADAEVRLLAGRRGVAGLPRRIPRLLDPGDSLDDLIDHLKDLYFDATSGDIPSIRRVGELVVS